MEVKGTAVVPIIKFVQTRFGDRYEEWVRALPEKSAGIMKNALVGSWYPLQDAMIEPTKKICDLFYGGKEDGARQLGKYSADFGLKGVYKLFIKFGSPSFIISKGSNILPTYYKDSVMKVVDEKKNSSTVHITSFPGIHRLIELRIAGWMEGALEACGCKNVRVDITRSLTKSDPLTEYICQWD